MRFWPQASPVSILWVGHTLSKGIGTRFPDSGLLLPTFVSSSTSGPIVTYDLFDFGYTSGLLSRIIGGRPPPLFVTVSHTCFRLFAGVPRLGSELEPHSESVSGRHGALCSERVFDCICHSPLPTARYHPGDAQGPVVSGLTAITGIAYFLAVFAALNLFHLVTGHQIFLLALVLAALTAVAMQPLRDKMQAGLDRRFFRVYHDVV